jgi:hypothetical protein
MIPGLRAQQRVRCAIAHTVAAVHMLVAMAARLVLRIRACPCVCVYARVQSLTQGRMAALPLQPILRPGLTSFQTGRSGPEAGFRPAAMFMNLSAGWAGEEISLPCPGPFKFRAAGWLPA